MMEWKVEERCDAVQADNSSVEVKNVHGSKHEINEVKTPASKTPLSSTTCHVLPCKIECQGMANTHVYFSPTSMGDDDGCHAATFRGRGLLAVTNDMRYSNDDSNPIDINSIKSRDSAMQGTLLSISEADEKHQIDVKATFDKTLEWRHEHNIDVVLFNASSGADQPKTNRVDVAIEWSKIAQALHARLEVE